jgi:hypothetical protein
MFLFQDFCADLDLRVEMPEDIVDLILEAAGEHLISLVQHKLLDLVRPDTKDDK